MLTRQVLYGEGSRCSKVYTTIRDNMHPLRRARYALPIQDVSVDHHRLDASMAKKLPHRPDVIPGLESAGTYLGSDRILSCFSRYQASKEAGFPSSLWSMKVIFRRA